MCLSVLFLLHIVYNNLCVNCVSSFHLIKIYVLPFLKSVLCCMVKHKTSVYNVYSVHLLKPLSIMKPNVGHFLTTKRNYFYLNNAMNVLYFLIQVVHAIFIPITALIVFHNIFMCFHFQVFIALYIYYSQFAWFSKTCLKFWFADLHNAICSAVKLY